MDHGSDVLINEYHDKYNSIDAFLGILRENEGQDRRDAELSRLQMENEWFCRHFSQGLVYNRDRLPSLESEDHHNEDSVEIKTLRREGGGGMVSEMHHSDCSPRCTYQSQIVGVNSSISKCGDSLPDLSIYPVEVAFLNNEKRRHDELCLQAGEPGIGIRYSESFIGRSMQELSRQELIKSLQDPGAGKNVENVLGGRRRAYQATLGAHLGMAAFRGLSLAWFRKRRDWSLPQLTQFVKKKGALNPEDHNRPLDSTEEVLQQFLWGAPKLRMLLIELVRANSRVSLGEVQDAQDQECLVFCHSPKIVETVLELLEYLGIRKWVPMCEQASEVPAGPNTGVYSELGIVCVNCSSDPYCLPLYIFRRWYLVMLRECFDIRSSSLGTRSI